MGVACLAPCDLLECVGSEHTSSQFNKVSLVVYGLTNVLMGFRSQCKKQKTKKTKQKKCE